MQQVAQILAILAITGAAVSWFAGAWFYVQTLRAISAVPGQSGLMLRALVAWPFAVKSLQGDAAMQAGKVNKAIVAFFVCLLVAFAAFAVSANLARVHR